MKILVIFTGGTIGSTKNGGVIRTDKSNAYYLLDLYGRLDSSVEFTAVQAYSLLSECLDGSHMNTLYNSINENNIERYDGVIVTHGTDTLQYCASYISYRLGLCSTPVVFVSANYPLRDERSNGLENFCAAVDFIRQKVGSGVFAAYKNADEKPKIHRASRLAAHIAYDDRLHSIFDECYGEIIDNSFFKNSSYRETADEVDLSTSEMQEHNSDVIKMNAYVNMNYPHIDDSVKAVIFETYHSGTLNTADEQLGRFCKYADSINVPIFLAGGCRGFYYESKLLYKTLKINVLPAASPIAMYVKLCLIKKDDLKDVFLPCGGDIFV